MVTKISALNSSWQNRNLESELLKELGCAGTDWWNQSNVFHTPEITSQAQTAWRESSG